jgi:hypothetical protein
LRRLTTDRFLFAKLCVTVQLSSKSLVGEVAVTVDIFSSVGDVAGGEVDNLSKKKVSHC